MSFPKIHRKKPNLELTPLIDVMFLLIIFFMLILPSETGVRIPISLPSANGKENLVNSNVYPITITDQNFIFCGDEKKELNDLTNWLIARKKNYEKVLIRGDSKSDFGIIISVWESAKTAGFKEVQISTQNSP